MSAYRLTPAAQDDLSEIWDYTDQQWGAQQAEIYLDDIRAAVQRASAAPGRGLACDEIRVGYRIYPAGSHLIFYVERDGGIDVVRILHYRMDPTGRL